MDVLSFETEVRQLIGLQQEGEYWDFKKEWHQNKADLLHDIICMANNLSNQDGLIIIGVDEENDYSICDVINDPNRRKTQDIVSFLREKKFAGGIRPTAYVQPVTLWKKTIDIIVIRNDRNTPYYLTEQYQGVFANNIYARIMDTNTPKNASADINIIEKLWKKRFGIDATALDRALLFLQKPYDWVDSNNGKKFYKYTRQFAGDGIMGIFQNSNVDDQNISSSCKAIKAARYIHTLIDFCLNPALKKSMDICIGCGVGICTGTIMITKVGMRGKESNKTAENETGIVWVGSTTNYANRYCSLAHPCEIFIDENTYSEIEDSEIWTKTSRTKGNKVFEGYAVSEHYLSLPEEITAEAVKADTENDSEASFIQNIFAETQEKALLLVDEISKKSAELAIALEEAKKREGQAIARDNESRKENIRLQQWQNKLNSKQADVDRQEQKNKEQAYSIHKSIFSETFCKSDLIKEFGKDHWLEFIGKMYELGKEIGKSQLEVKIDLDCYLIGIYRCFGMYEEAYEILCVQAEHSSWLNQYILEDVVKQSGHWFKLKGILEKRVYEGKDYRECLDKLKSMGY